MCDGDLFKLLFIKYKSFLRPVKIPENTLKSRIQHARTLPHKNSSFGNSLLRFLFFSQFFSSMVLLLRYPKNTFCRVLQINLCQIIYFLLYIFILLLRYCYWCWILFFRHTLGLLLHFFYVARCLFFSLIQKVEMWQEPKRSRGVKKREPKRKVFSSAQYGGKLRTFARIAYTLTQMSDCVCTLQYVPNWLEWENRKF